MHAPMRSSISPTTRRHCISTLSTRGPNVNTPAGVIRSSTSGSKSWNRPAKSRGADRSVGSGSGTRRRGAVMRVTRLRAVDVVRVGDIERSEHVDLEYRVVDGQLQPVPAVMTEVPNWDKTGS